METCWCTKLMNFSVTICKREGASIIHFRKHYNNYVYLFYLTVLQVLPNYFHESITFFLISP
jgi:hypothetical protein